MRSVELSTAMANFSVRPFGFVRMGAQIERGPDHRLVDDPPLSHKRYALVTATPPVLDH